MSNRFHKVHATAPIDFGCKVVAHQNEDFYATQAIFKKPITPNSPG